MPTQPAETPTTATTPVTTSTTAPTASAAIAAERRAALAAHCERYDVDAVYAFGSRAHEALAWLRGEVECLAYGGSDIDIAVKGPGSGSGRDLSLDDKVGLTIALEDFFQVARVDLVTFAEAGAFLAVDIIRGERLYAADVRRADELDLYILRRAGDLAPFERQRRALVLGIRDPR